MPASNVRLVSPRALEPNKMENQCLMAEQKLDVGFYRYSLLNRGGDRLILEYANHLAARGHAVTLYAREIKTVFKLHPLLHVKHIPYPGRLGSMLYGTTRCLGHDVVIVDIIHLPLALSLRNRVLYYAQADDREYYSSALKRFGIDVLYRLHYRSRKPIISMSQHLTDLFHRRYSVTKAHTVQTGIDHGTFYPDADKTLSVSKGAHKAIVFMARGDSYRKGYDIGLKVFDALNKAAPGTFEVWICGNELDDSKFDYPIKNFGVVDDGRLRQMLSSADMFLYPSRHEGFGLFPLEAMACGCAVVTTEAIPYARTSRAAFCSRIEDVTDLTRNLTMLIRDAALLDQRKKTGIHEAGFYDLEKSKSEFESALFEIIMDR
jgi:glycosyltransferase involved in cell wall biosynthesis